MRTLHLLLLLCALAFRAGAGDYGYSDLLTLGGTKARFESAEPLHPASDCALWEIPAHDGNDIFDVSFRRRGESALSVMLPHMRYDFGVKGDTILRMCRETPFYILSDSIAALFAVPQPSSAACELRGRLYHTQYLYGKGRSTVEAELYGRAVLSMGDTVDAVLSTTVIDASLTVSDRPLASAGSAPLRRETYRRWTIPGEVLPFYVSFESCITTAEGTELRSARAYRIIDNDRSAPRRKPQHKRTPAQSASGPVVQVENGTVYVVSPSECQSIVLTDAFGLVRARLSDFSYDGSAYTLSIASLKEGEYVIYASSEGSSTVYKFAIRP